jgi:hypothetical protein
MLFFSEQPESQVKRPALHFLLSIIAILAIPFAYNSCQGGLLNRKGFAAAIGSSQSCKVGLYKGELTKFEDPGDPFSSNKVQLVTQDGSNVYAKAGDPDIPANSRLSVILENACLQANAAMINNTTITRQALGTSQIHPGLSRQAFEWRPTRTYTASEIDNLVAAETCIRGLSWNRAYKFQSTYLNDSQGASQGYLPMIRQADALDIFYGQSGMSRTGINSVIVAVVDTGADITHTDISGNLWRHLYGTGIDITSLSGTVNYSPTDVSGIGHGTHVAGMIAAVSNNSVGISGAMPFRAQLMVIRLFTRNATTGELSTTSQHLYNALKFAQLNGAKVINLSLGNVTNGPNTDSVTEAGINEAVAAGSVVVTVTGNAEGASGSEMNGTTLTSIPGIFATKAGVIGVGSIDTSTGTKSIFSHYSTVYGEIAAPGAESSSLNNGTLTTSGLLSTIPTNNYGRLAGTSQAAPLVSAAAAMAMGMIREVRGAYPTPAEVERLILTSAVKDGRLQPYFKDGNRLDLLNLAQRIAADYPNDGSSSMDLSSSSCP